MWVYITIFVLLGAIIYYIFFSGKLLGNWLFTLNQVISSYVAIRQLNPENSDEEVFLEVLDNRFDKFRNSSNQIQKNLYIDKEEGKEAIIEEIQSGMSIINKYNLPILIYLCLLIENNSIIRSKKYNSQEDLLSLISDEVKRQGFGKYI
jgi:hypothetical protein